MFYFLSLVCVAFGQPAWSAWLAPIAAFLGYALFWKSCEKLKSSKKIFWSSLLWYAGVQAIQLSWMTAVEYQGFYILFVYIALLFLLGLQFGLLTHCVLKSQNLTCIRGLTLASLWILLEWSRLFLFCGLSWNPSGMALAGTLYSLQFASLVGVLGLSFWVILSNVMTLSFLKTVGPSGVKLKKGFYALALMAIPYLFGYFQLHYLSHTSEKKLDVALVQTNLLPPQKIYLSDSPSVYVPAFEQWKRIVSALQDALGEQKIDLIVLPEAAVPYLAHQKVYSYDRVKEFMVNHFGEEIESLFPPSDCRKVSNLFLAQILSNWYQAEVVLGLDDREETLNENYQSAYHIFPNSEILQRHEKKILLPLAEYLPFRWLESYTAKYGIREFYTPGKELKIVQGSLPMALSICYEETFSSFMREGRAKGAQLFVNVTNDNWYPNSQLPQQHFEHAKLRCVENGIPLVRACNIGVTGVIDSFGRVVAQKLEKGKDLGVKSDVIVASVPLYTYQTIYSKWGDLFLIIFASGFIGVFCLKNLAENVSMG